MSRTFASALIAFAIGCSGGGGSLDEGSLDRQDPEPISNEQAGKTNQSGSPTNESVARTDEGPTAGSDAPSSGGGGGGSFSCHGTYQCTTTGTGSTRTSTIVLDGSAGNCTSDGGGINADGTITDDKGQVVAHWTGGDSGFSFTSTDTETDVTPTGTTTTNITVTVSCTKVSDSTTPVADNSSSSSSGGSAGH